MYAGYRLKINDETFPDTYIARGSYSCVEDKRIVETWTDASLVEHQITTDVPKATITFSIAEHSNDIHADIMEFFQQGDDITIEYYADQRDVYRTSNFRLEPIKFSHKFAVGNQIFYEKAEVKLIEN